MSMVNQIIIDDLPRFLQMDDYNLAKQEFASLCRRVGIGTDEFGYFGNISFPGISDIDALVIGSSSQLKHLQHKFEEKKLSSDIFAAVFWHPPVYLLKEVSQNVHFLHTLEGLDDGLLSRLEKLESDYENEHQFFLNIIWFTFLVRGCINIFSEADISLRNLLLVYKNLEFSERVFCKFLNVSSEKSVRSDYLRENFLKSDQENIPNLMKIFHEKLQLTLNLFDSCCGRFELEGSSENNYSKHLVINKKCILKKSSNSKFTNHRYFTEFEVNPVAYEIAEQFMFSRCETRIFSDYIFKSWETVLAYNKVGLNYPFITPFGIKIQGNKMLLIRKINQGLSILF